jgi:acetoin utilization protein AcuB
MLVSEITQSSIPVLHYDDTVEEAIELLQQNNVQHLPVLNDDKYEGLLSLDELSTAQDSDTIASLKNKFIHVSIPANQHFLTALKIIATANVSVLPVLSQNNEYTGTVSQQELLHALYTYLSCDEPGGIFVVEMDKQKFSVGELCRLVETNDAFVTQLNTQTEHLSGLLIVTFKINKTEISDILATLQRYEYAVRYYFGEEYYENELKENFENLMSYLNV